MILSVDPQIYIYHTTAAVLVVKVPSLLQFPSINQFDVLCGETKMVDGTEGDTETEEGPGRGEGEAEAEMEREATKAAVSETGEVKAVKHPTASDGGRAPTFQAYLLSLMIAIRFADATLAVLWTVVAGACGFVRRLMATTLRKSPVSARNQNDVHLFFFEVRDIV